MPLFERLPTNVQEFIHSLPPLFVKLPQRLYGSTLANRVTTEQLQGINALSALFNVPILGQPCGAYKRCLVLSDDLGVVIKVPVSYVRGAFDCIMRERESYAFAVQNFPELVAEHEWPHTWIQVAEKLRPCRREVNPPAPLEQYFTDLHGANFGYTPDNRLKLLDLGGHSVFRGRPVPF